ILVIRAKGVIVAGSEDNVHVLQGSQPCWVVLILDEVARIIEIDVVVRVAVGKALDVVEATHPNRPVNQVRIAKGEIDGMVSTEACAGSDNEWVGVEASG